MYKKPVVINSEQHSRLRFTPAENFDFARDVTNVPVTLHEIVRLAREFPIVFESTTGQPIVVLGVTEGQNLYLDEKSQWRAAAVPAAISAYPFGLYKMEDAQSDDQIDYVMIMDEEASTLQAEQGKLLYNKQRNGFRPSPLLKSLSHHLEEIQRQRQLTEGVAQQLLQAGVLKSHQIGFQSQAGLKKLAGISVIDWDKVNQLDDETKSAWQAAGLLDVLKAQQASLKNFQLLHQWQQDAKRHASPVIH